MTPTHGIQRATWATQISDTNDAKRDTILPQAKGMFGNRNLSLKGQRFRFMVPHSSDENMV